MSKPLLTTGILFWPQLPGLSFKELMVPQHLEGLPFLKIDVQTETMWIGRNSYDEFERFYESSTEEGRSGNPEVISTVASRLLKELIDVKRDEGGISGIHRCGNADWPKVIDCWPDIINFDDYDYTDTNRA